MIALRLRTLAPSKDDPQDGSPPRMMMKKKALTLNPEAWGGSLLRLNTGVDTPSHRRTQSARDVRSEWSPDSSHRSPTAPQQRSASARNFGGVRGLGSLRTASTSKLEQGFWQVQRGTPIQSQEPKDGWATNPKKVVFAGKEEVEDGIAEAVPGTSAGGKDEKGVEGGNATPRLGGVEVKVGGAERNNDTEPEYVRLVPAWGFESPLTQSPLFRISSRRSAEASPDATHMSWGEEATGHASRSEAGSSLTRSPPPRATYTSVQGHTPRRPSTASARLIGGGGGTVFGGRVGLGALASGHAAMRQVVEERDLRRERQRPQSAYAARARGLIPTPQRPQTAQKHASRPSSARVPHPAPR